jgi:hypothetical protein
MGQNPIKSISTNIQQNSIMQQYFNYVKSYQIKAFNAISLQRLKASDINESFIEVFIYSVQMEGRPHRQIITAVHSRRGMGPAATHVRSSAVSLNQTHSYLNPNGGTTYSIASSHRNSLEIPVLCT